MSVPISFPVAVFAAIVSLLPFPSISLFIEFPLIFTNTPFEVFEKDKVSFVPLKPFKLLFAVSPSIVSVPLLPITFSIFVNVWSETLLPIVTLANDVSFKEETLIPAAEINAE